MWLAGAAGIGKSTLAAESAAGAGLINGVTATTFEPEGALDRRTSLILRYRLELLIDPQVG